MPECHQRIDGTLPSVIYNTEIFEVADVNDLRRALESLRDVMTDAGGTDLRIYQSVDDPTKVLAGCSGRTPKRVEPSPSTTPLRSRRSSVLC